MDNYELFLAASSHWESGDIRRAFRLFLKAAEGGDSSSQHNVGFFYDEGLGVRRDKKKALYWYKRAWRGDGQSSTCSNIARLYAGDGNAKRAIYWWSRAVELGDGDAALDLAKFLISRGRDVANHEVLYLVTFAMTSAHALPSTASEARTLLGSQ